MKKTLFIILITFTFTLENTHVENLEVNIENNILVTVEKR